MPADRDLARYGRRSLDTPIRITRPSNLDSLHTWDTFRNRGSFQYGDLDGWATAAGGDWLPGRFDFSIETPGARALNVTGYDSARAWLDAWEGLRPLASNTWLALSFSGREEPGKFIVFANGGQEEAWLYDPDTGRSAFLCSWVVDDDNVAKYIDRSVSSRSEAAWRVFLQGVDSNGQPAGASGVLAVPQTLAGFGASSRLIISTAGTEVRTSPLDVSTYGQRVDGGDTESVELGQAGQVVYGRRSEWLIRHRADVRPGATLLAGPDRWTVNNIAAIGRRRYLRLECSTSAS